MLRTVLPFAKRPLSAWIEDLQRAASAEERYRALLAVISLGSVNESVRWCRHAVHDADSGVRALAAKQLGELKRREMTDDPTSAVWTEVAEDLATLLTDNDPDVRFEAARGLGRVDLKYDAARAVLLSLLEEDEAQPLMIGAVVAALAERPDIQPAPLVDRYRKLLTHERAEVRESVSAAVASWGKVAAELVGELTVALDDEEPLVRENSAVALGRAGIASEPVLTALRAASSDEDEGVAAVAHEALRSLSSP